MKLSIVTPAFNEAENLPLFLAELEPALASSGLEWEWIVVDDHSRDSTWTVLQELAAREPRLKGIRLARNAGSHKALLCGLERAQGDCAVVMASDLQDPVEVIPRLVEKWKDGAQVVWAVREGGEEAQSLRWSSRAYYWFMKAVIGFRDMPATGADFFLADRRVLDALQQHREINANVFSLLMWMGFRQAHLEYKKQDRRSGTSSWTFKRRLKLFIDSVTSFSYFPIRWMSLAGVLIAFGGFVYALILILNRAMGRPPEGWTALIVAILVMGGLQMVMMGVLGEYLWRALDEARSRPRFIVEDETASLKKG